MQTFQELQADPQFKILISSISIVALSFIGRLLKRNKDFRDEDIPSVLTVIGAVIGFIVFHDINAFGLGLSAVGINQLQKQFFKKGDK